MSWPCCTSLTSSSLCLLVLKCQKDDLQSVFGWKLVFLVICLLPWQFSVKQLQVDVNNLGQHLSSNQTCCCWHLTVLTTKKWWHSYVTSENKDNLSHCEVSVWDTQVETRDETQRWKTLDYFSVAMLQLVVRKTHTHTHKPCIFDIPKTALRVNCPGLRYLCVFAKHFGVEADPVVRDKHPSLVQDVFLQSTGVTWQTGK